MTKEATVQPVEDRDEADVDILHPVVKGEEWMLVPLTQPVLHVVASHPGDGKYVEAVDAEKGEQAREVKEVVGEDFLRTCNKHDVAALKCLPNIYAV